MHVYGKVGAHAGVTTVIATATDIGVLSVTSYYLWLAFGLKCGAFVAFFGVERFCSPRCDRVRG
jgi:hypothetical protein